jgi:hypothetical protein
MPRRSAADIDFAPLIAPADDRPAPPADMGEAARAIWNDVVSAMRSRWFTRENVELLARYAHAMAETRRLEAELDRTSVSFPAYDRISQRLNATATLALSYARALRITPRGNKESKVDGRDSRRSNLPKPWEPLPPGPWND